MTKKGTREVIFTIRLTKDEYNELIWQAENEDKKPSQLARERIFKKEDK